MSDSSVAIFIIWLFVFTYSILGSIDFGAGFWSMVFAGRKGSSAADIANRYLSPTWKVTNVFLVLLVVALVGFFPFAMPLLSSLLVVPVCLVLVLLTLRSTFMVYSQMSAKYVPQLRLVSGLTGLLIPGLLVTALPATLGGFVEMNNGHMHVMAGKSMASRSFMPIWPSASPRSCFSRPSSWRITRGKRRMERHIASTGISPSHSVRSHCRRVAGRRCDGSRSGVDRGSG